VPDERAVSLEARHAIIKDPTIFTVRPPQAVFHRKLPPRIKGLMVDLNTPVQILRVNSLCPAGAELLLQRPSCKIEPAFVEKRTELVGARHPDHHGRRISHGTEAIFALA